MCVFSHQTVIFYSTASAVPLVSVLIIILRDTNYVITDCGTETRYKQKMLQSHKEPSQAQMKNNVPDTETQRNKPNEGTRTRDPIDNRAVRKR